MVRYGYIRVSTGEQNNDLQKDSLLGNGIAEENIVEEVISGAIEPMRRPALSKLLNNLKPGDELMVWKLDRLGRSALDMLQLEQFLSKHHIKLSSVTEGLTTETHIGQFYYQLLASLAQMERETLRERVLAGLEAARLRGRQLGRPKKLRADTVRQVQILRQSGEPIKEIMKGLHLGRTTVYRALRMQLPDEPDE